MTNKPNTLENITRLQQMMRQLYDRQNGCAWCQRQTLNSISDHTIEEAYELAAAIHSGNLHDIKDELADMLLQLLFYCQIGEMNKLFSLQEISAILIAKNIRRNPHVFDNAPARSLAEILEQRETIKQQERQKKQTANDDLFHNIPMALPAITKAKKQQQRAATLGFDWENIEQLLSNLEQEVAELRQAVKAQAAMPIISTELGDILYSCINFARHFDFSPEQALEQTNDKFRQRIAYIHQHKKKCWQDMSREDMLELWQQAKTVEKHHSKL